MPPTMRPARLVFRQLRLTLVSLTTVVVLGTLTGLLMGSGSMPLFFLGVLVAVIVLFAGILLWTQGEDVDDQPLWIIGYSLAVFALIGPILFGLPKVYLDHRGEPTAAVVTEDVEGAAQAGSDQRIEVRRAGAGGEALGRLSVRADRDLGVGDQVTVLVDPVGWLEPDSGQVPAFRVRLLAYSMGFGGLGVVLLLTVGRIVRDLRRWRRAGKGTPPRGKPADVKAARPRASGGKVPKRNPAAQPSRREPRPIDPDKATDLLERADPGGDSDGDSGGD